MAETWQLSEEQLHSGITEILKTGELTELTSRIVRNRLEEKFKVSLRERKKKIDELLMSILQEQDEDNERLANGMNGASTGDNDESEKEVLEKSAIKRLKMDKKGVDDEEIARKMHENERGLRARKKQRAKKPQKTPKKKEPSSGKSNTGYSRLMVLSPVLANIVGTDRMSRADVVKIMWATIKERDLADPSDRRYHICDDQLMKVFGQKRVKTFSMMKYLKQHVKDPSLIT